jgi:hypothetical protein
MAAGALDSDPVRYHLYAVVVHIDWGRSTDYGVQQRGPWGGRGRLPGLMLAHGLVPRARNIQRLANCPCHC